MLVGVGQIVLREMEMGMEMVMTLGSVGIDLGSHGKPRHSRRKAQGDRRR